MQDKIDGYKGKEKVCRWDVNEFRFGSYLLKEKIGERFTEAVSNELYLLLFCFVLE